MSDRKNRPHGPNRRDFIRVGAAALGAVALGAGLNNLRAAEELTVNGLPATWSLQPGAEVELLLTAAFEGQPAGEAVPA